MYPECLYDNTWSTTPSNLPCIDSSIDASASSHTGTIDIFQYEDILEYSSWQLFIFAIVFWFVVLWSFLFPRKKIWKN